uniref:28S ribosomal protein S27 n=1 Tax=Schistocephalus solidus TaxID=70667 RepID=A0A0X3P0L3_SCHSO
MYTLRTCLPAFHRSWYCLRQLFQRGIVSSTYQCEELWASRLKAPAFNTHSAADLGTQILYRLSNSIPVTPFDYDVFVNKVQLTDNTFLDFLEKIIVKFGKTQSALHVLPSTAHALVRLYMHHNEEARLLDILRRRKSDTCIFLDEVSANLLLRQFLAKKDLKSALNVIWELCLQSYLEENFLRPYLLCHWLETISLAVQLDEILTKHNEEPLQEEDENEEVDFRRVPYLRNPNYDAWFDIARPRLQLGHCCLSLAKALERDCSPSANKAVFSTMPALSSLAPTLRLLGFALTENTNDLLSYLRKAVESPGDFPVLDQQCLTCIGQLIESCATRPEDADVRPGEPSLLKPSEVSAALEKFKHLSGRLKPTEKTLHTEIANFVAATTADETILAQEKARVEELYTDFATTRDKVWQREISRIRRKNVLHEVKSKLRELLDEEERLTYFDNLGTIEHRAWLAPRTRRERQWSRLKEWKQELQEHQARKQGSRESFSEV